MSSFQDVLDAPAMLSEKERLALTHAAGSLAPGSVIIDLGTSAGGSAYLFRCAAPDCAVHTVDINDKIHRTPFEDEGLSIFRGNIQAFVETYPNVSPDMVFIDASHYFFDVLDDYRTLAGIMKDGTILSFHDCSAPKFPGITTICKTLSDNGNIRKGHVFDSLFIGEFNAAEAMPKTELFVENMCQFGEMLGVWVNASPVFTPSRTLMFEQIMASLRSDSVDAPWVIGQGKRGEDFARFVGFTPSKLVHSSEVNGQEPVCLVCSHYYGEIAGSLKKEKGARPDDIIDVNEFIQFCFYHDLAFNGGKAAIAKANTEFQKEVLALLAEQPARRLRRLYEYGCLENLLEDVFIR